MRWHSWASFVVAAIVVAFGDGSGDDPVVIAESHDGNDAVASARRLPRFGGGFRPSSSPRPSYSPRPSPPVSYRPAPAPTPPGGGARRRGPVPRPPPVPAPVPNPSSRRRGAVSPAIPSSSLGGSAVRRRIDNSDRINPNPNPRRRSSSGWETDYARRRGYSGSTVAAAGLVGFGGGLVLGSMINSGSGTYYYHDQGWTDMNGVYHQSGYYSDTGYHYSSPQQFGYCPRFGEPGYMEGCDTTPNSYQNENPVIGIIGTIIYCCCCLCCMLACYHLFCSNSDGGGGKPYGRQYDEEVELMEDRGNVYTLSGAPVTQSDAIGFLQAVEAEYIDGKEGAVQELFDGRSYSQEAMDALLVDEEAIRNAEDKQDAVQCLAQRWRMMHVLQHG